MCVGINFPAPSQICPCVAVLGYMSAVYLPLNLKPRFAFSPLRVAISGKKISPPLFECMEILGKSLTISRLDSLANSL